MGTRARLARHLAAPDLACGITGTLPTSAWHGVVRQPVVRPTGAERLALVERPTVRVTLHTKARGTVEVRLLSQLPNGAWHRLGTLCMARTIWERDWRPLLTSGAASNDIDLSLSEAA